MIACYVRVSTQEQHLENQKTEIAKWLKLNGIDQKMVMWFEDVGTGNDLSRPQFMQMQRHIHSGRVKTVVMWKLDRVSRRLRDGVNLLSDWTSLGLRVVSTTQQIDVSGIMGQMVASMMFGLAELEQSQRKERQEIGIARAKDEGKYKGRKPGSITYCQKRLASLLLEPITYKEIANCLNISVSTIDKYVKDNPGARPKGKRGSPSSGTATTC